MPPKGFKWHNFGIKTFRSPKVILNRIKQSLYSQTKNLNLILSFFSLLKKTMILSKITESSTGSNFIVMLSAMKKEIRISHY